MNSSTGLASVIALAAIAALVAVVRHWPKERKIAYRPAAMVPEPTSPSIKTETVLLAGLNGAETPTAERLTRIAAALNAKMAGAVRIVTTPPKGSIALTITPGPSDTLRFDTPAGSDYNNYEPVITLPEDDARLEDMLFLRLANVTGAVRHALNAEFAATLARLDALVEDVHADRANLDVLLTLIFYGLWPVGDNARREALIQRALRFVPAETSPERWKALQGVLWITLDRLDRLREALAIVDVLVAQGAIHADWVTHLRYRIGLAEKIAPWVEAGLAMRERTAQHILTKTRDEWNAFGNACADVAKDFLTAGQLFGRTDWLEKARAYAIQALSLSCNDREGVRANNQASAIITAVDAVLPRPQP